jgi:single-strand DNA-binding protein
MSSLNRVTLIGNVGREPEMRTFNNGGRMCQLAIATSERWKDKQSGEHKETTEWHNVVVLADRLVDLCETYITKGAKLYIEGQLVTRKWQDKSGADRYSTEIQLKNYNGKIVLLDSKKQGETQSVTPQNFQAPPARDLDDEIPF